MSIKCRKPTIIGFDNTLSGTSDGFIARFLSSGGLNWSSYYGGSGADSAAAISIDNSDNFVITGLTSSSDFPVLYAYNDTFGAG